MEMVTSAGLIKESHRNCAPKQTQREEWRERKGLYKSRTDTL